jgi:hypothetical protein
MALLQRVSPPPSLFYFYFYLIHFILFSKTTTYQVGLVGALLHKGRLGGVTFFLFIGVIVNKWL